MVVSGGDCNVYALFAVNVPIIRMVYDSEGIPMNQTQIQYIKTGNFMVVEGILHSNI